MVVATRDRCDSLLHTLERLRALPERPAVVVVDNGSSDGTAAAARSAFPEVEVVELDRNLGPAARTVGVRRVATPYAAFSDDDSWWSPGSLSHAADVLERYPRLGLVAARVLVGVEERDDPTCEEMRRSPLASDLELPGPPVLGFIACGAVVRREAFLDVGGFHERLATGAEETLLAVDLAVKGWLLAYVEDCVAHHYPSPRRDGAARRRGEAWNELALAWLRLPLREALRRTLAIGRSAAKDPASRSALLEALGDAPWLARERRVVPGHVEDALRRIRA